MGHGCQYRWLGSNQRPTPYEGGALPTELHRCDCQSRRWELNPHPSLYESAARPVELRRRCCSSGPGGDRTHDFLFKRQALSRLSYKALPSHLPRFAASVTANRSLSVFLRRVHLQDPPRGEGLARARKNSAREGPLGVAKLSGALGGSRVRQERGSKRPSRRSSDPGRGGAFAQRHGGRDDRQGGRIPACPRPPGWVVDPHAYTVVVSALGKEPELFNAQHELSGEPHLPGFRVPVARIFAR